MHTSALLLLQVLSLAAGHAQRGNLAPAWSSPRCLREKTQGEDLSKPCFLCLGPNCSSLFISKGEAFYDEGGEALAQVAQRNCGWPITGNVQSQVGWGFEQADPAKDVPAHGKGVGLEDL